MAPPAPQDAKVAGSPEPDPWLHSLVLLAFISGSRWGLRTCPSTQT